MPPPVRNVRKHDFGQGFVGGVLYRTFAERAGPRPEMPAAEPEPCPSSLFRKPCSSAVRKKGFKNRTSCWSDMPASPPWTGTPHSRRMRCGRRDAGGSSPKRPPGRTGTGREQPERLPALLAGKAVMPACNSARSRLEPPERVLRETVRLPGPPTFPESS